jgi:hypothetical protein
MLQSLADAGVNFGVGRFEDAYLEISANASAVPMGGDIHILLFEGNAHKDPISKENGENDLMTSLESEIIKLLISKRV